MHFGIGKLSEEIGELHEVLAENIMQRQLGRLSQLLGKLIPFPVGAHPDEKDGKKPLRERLIEEIADVRAALYYFEQENLTEDERMRIAKRISAKVSKFNKWGLTGIPAKPVEKSNG